MDSKEANSTKIHRMQRITRLSEPSEHVLPDALSIDPNETKL